MRWGFESKINTATGESSESVLTHIPCAVAVLSIGTQSVSQVYNRTVQLEYAHQVGDSSEPARCASRLHAQMWDMALHQPYYWPGLLASLASRHRGCGRRAPAAPMPTCLEDLLFRVAELNIRVSQLRNRTHRSVQMVGAR